MAAIDGMLVLLSGHGADELRLATNEAPTMFAGGAPRRLSMPPTTAEMLAHLLEPLLTPDRDAELRRRGSVELDHASGRESFHVVVTLAQGGALKATFVRGARRRSAAVPAVPAVEEVPVAPVVASRASRSGEEAPRDAGERASAPPLLRAILEEASARRASDVHLCDGAVPSLRIDGRLLPLRGAPVVSVEALLAGLPGDALRAAAAGERALEAVVESDGARFRLNVFRTADGLAAAIRVLPRSAPRLGDLGLPSGLGDLALAPHGLVVVCGATGSGKSATLGALAQLAVQKRGALLISLEDPVEYVIDPGTSSGLVRQRQIGRDVPDFATGLRDALREDPDVLLVGEMRDAATIDLVLAAAETGHLVLATLHSGSAAAAIDRIVSGSSARQKDEVRGQLAASLRAVVAQRLLPRASGNGRVVAVEVLRGTHGVTSLVREGRTAQLATAIQSGRKEGMVTLEASLAELVRAGQVARAEAEATANDTTALAGYLEGAGR
jgi:twitching motility protein PilT